MPSLQWHLLYRAFETFAVLARECHFYTESIDKMEKSIFEMSPYPTRKDDLR